MKTLDIFLSTTGLALMTAGFMTAATVPARAQNVVGPMLVAEQCSPLTDANYEACCMAQNRAEILTAEQINQCPPLSTASIGGGFSTTNSDSGPRNLNGDNGTGGGGDPGGGGGQDNGKGNQDHGKGNQDHGKGNQDDGKGDQDDGKGDQDDGKGNQDRGLKGNQDDHHRDDGKSGD